MEAAELAEWWDVVALALDVCAELYRVEPGFSVIHAAPREASEHDGEPELAHRVARLMEHEFGIADEQEVRFRLGVSLEIGGVLIHRAFERDVDGDRRYLDEARRLVREYLDEHLAERARANGRAIRCPRRP
jgi:hypothetical protein